MNISGRRCITCLASRLSSAEIVLGKLGARLVHVLAFVALGLPIVSLLMLYGGLNPTSIFYVYLGTATLVLFTSGFSILISILAQRPRDAILATYGLGALWLLLPDWLQRYTDFLDGPLGVGAAGQRRASLLESARRVADLDPSKLFLDDPDVDAGLDAELERVSLAIHDHDDHPGVIRADLSAFGHCPSAAAKGQLMAGRSRRRAGGRGSASVTGGSSNRGPQRPSPATSCWRPELFDRPSAKIPCSGKSDTRVWEAA